MNQLSKVDWDEIMTASEASVKLNKNPKYIYLLWRDNSNMLLEGSVQMKGGVLLISKEGYEHLKPLAKKGEDLVNTASNYKVKKQNDNAILLCPLNP